MSNVKIELKTTAYRIESANVIIARAIETLLERPERMASIGVNKKDVIAAGKFREDLLASFLHPQSLTNLNA